MSAIAIDLYIQDFITTNKILGQHLNWEQLVNRRFAESGGLKIFEFTSGGDRQLARAQLIQLPDSDWLRVELSRALPQGEEQRFPCLQMTQARTHGSVVSESVATGTLVVRMETRHRGLINVVFVVREPGLEEVRNQFLM